MRNVNLHSSHFLISLLFIHLKHLFAKFASFYNKTLFSSSDLWRQSWCTNFKLPEQRQGVINWGSPSCRKRLNYIKTEGQAAVLFLFWKFQPNPLFKVSQTLLWLRIKNYWWWWQWWLMVRNHSDIWWYFLFFRRAETQVFLKSRHVCCVCLINFWFVTPVILKIYIFTFEL